MFEEKKKSINQSESSKSIITLSYPPPKMFQLPSFMLTSPSPFPEQPSFHEGFIDCGEKGKENNIGRVIRHRNLTRPLSSVGRVIGGTQIFSFVVSSIRMRDRSGEGRANDRRNSLIWFKGFNRRDSAFSQSVCTYTMGAKADSMTCYCWHLTSFFFNLVIFLLF